MSIDKLAALIRNPSIEYRPEIRWWLAEGLHTDQTLRHEIDRAHRLGYGGMEFLAMDEPAIDHRLYGWGSEEWVHDSQIVVDETSDRGMAVSFTSGTNWSNANIPTITPDDPAAAQELDVVTERLSGGESRTGPLSQIDLAAIRVPEGMPMHRDAATVQSFVAAVAVRIAETRLSGPPVLDANSAIDLTQAVVDGELEWTAPEGDWMLCAYWMHGTGQTASPSVDVNYTVNYLDRAGIEAVIDYWDTVVLTPELRAGIARNARVQMYMDSLELWTFGAGGLFWGATVADEFLSRRGYDIRPWLPFLTRDVEIMASSTVYHHEPLPGQALTVAKVRHDYVSTLTDLYIENMLRPFAEFLHANGMGLRAEISYGMPFELTRPGPEVDGIENESLEFAAQIDAYRLLAGPAHLFGKQYSSETGATTRNHMLDHRFYDQIINTQLAAGITKTVMHGWASTAGAEGMTEWPGHEGMLSAFSERFDERQPAAEFYPLWTEALARVQAVLRQGKPRIDVGILRTDHFTDNGTGMALLADDGTRIPDEDAYGQMWMRDRQNHWWQDLGMQDAGWTYEFFDGSLLLRDDVELRDGLVQPDGPGYQALIVYQEGLDADVARLLLDWASKGLPVLLVHGASEVKLLTAKSYIHHARAADHTPGLDGRDEELAAIIAELLTLPSVLEVATPSGTLGALRSLGVAGRAEFVGDNQSILSHLRDDGELTHLYAYHYLYETGSSTEVEFVLEGTGAVHRIDAWTGDLTPHGDVRTVDGRTVVRAELSPGEIGLWTLDRSASHGAGAERSAIVAELGEWSIRVESWDAGENELITEDRGLGYETREIRPSTAITTRSSSESSLRPWRELAGIGADVSGVGHYETQFTLDSDPTGTARIVLDLGSTAGGLGSVAVNGGTPRGFDTSRPRVDITSDVRAGSNVVVVRVASSLNNRLIARGYYDEMVDIVGTLMTGVPSMQPTTVRDHGLLGPVRVEVVTLD
ncbi:glycosyl hydrolase [Salinibacterium sp. SYSU T00001]|uniref:glycosyl hydrolase n=1 Tax=Homoserinimonas sedimenticola TaxID=2986805 RepID=UPI002235C05D|nr:glycosyl hydrolase [Salinibacterium sedimenticola]MCW4385700.1 glycosyl hydrolase [Salinibacterium sedimenticola]